MLPKHGSRRATAALVLAASLGGCLDARDWTMADSGSGGLFAASWGGMRADRPESSETVRRIRGYETPQEPLELEPGNVWPAEEAPRATLANPDAALRGVPPYRPGEPRTGERLWDQDDRSRERTDRMDEPPPEARRPTTRRRGASSPPPPPLAQPAPERVEVLPVPPRGNAPPGLPDYGRAVLTPGGPVVTTGGNDRVQGFTTPGGGSGIIQRDGNVTTISPSGGPPQTFITPR